LEKLYLIIFTAALVLSCSQTSSDTLILSNLPENIDVEFPMELLLKDHNESELIAQSKLDGNIFFLLQKTPSIFTNEKFNYSSILPN
jgi:hypothetical protein